MREWIRHNRRRPCPACSGTKKGCRTNTKTNIVHCRGDDPSSEYRFLREDKHGFGMYKLEAEIEEFSEQKKQEWLGEKQREREQKQRQREQELKQQLPDRKRDRAIRNLLSQLSLTEDHRAQLQARGLTDDQIAEAGYRSVTQWQPLNQQVSPRLPGVNCYGNKLITPDSGILIPIPNEKGQWVGYQLRRDHPEDGNKYLWSASETKRENRPTVKNRDDELPLGVWGSRSDDGVVYLCESPGIKPYIASLRLNHPVIGAAGNNFASSPNALYRALTQLGAKKIVILPDAGAIINRHIHEQIKQAVDLLTNWGYQDIAIAWWGQIEKGDGDIDEISDDALASIEHLSTAEYFDKAEQLQRDRHRRDTKNAIAKLTNVDKRINKKYFEPKDLADMPEGCHIGWIVGKQDTGKSVTAKSQALKARQKGKAVFGNTHRRLLSRLMSRKWSQDGTYIPFVEDKGGPQSEIGFTFVINSMHLESQAQFSSNDSRLKGAFVFFDEFDQMLDALFNDSTMENRRALIAQNLAKTIQNVVASGGTVFFASADIYDFHKQFVEDIFKQTCNIAPKSYTIVNDYNPVAEEGCDLRFYDAEGPDDSPAGIYADTIQLIEEGNKILLQTTSQTVESPYSTKNLEADLRKRFPNLRILRWDSETNRDPNHEAFGFAEKLSNDQTVVEYYDIIIMSPVAETGVSIDDPNGHFDYNSIIFNSGNQDTRAIRQTIRRLRKLVPRLVYVAPRSNSKIGTGKTTPRGVLRDNSRQVTKLKSILLSAGVTEEENELDLGDGDDFQLFLKPWAYSATLKNLDFADYRNAAREALEKEGYTIERTSGAYDILLGYEYSQGYEEAKEELGETRDDNKEAHYEAIVKKSNPDDDRYEQLQNKTDKTADEQLEQEKGFLARAYNVDIDYRLVEKHNEGRKDWLQKLKLHYHLTDGNQFLNEKERSMLESLTEGNGKAFGPEAVRRSKLLKIHWLKEFGIDQFLDHSSDFEDGLCSDVTFTEEDLQTWYDSAIQKERELKQFLGVNVWGKNKNKEWERVAPKTLADRFLALVDLGLQSFQRRNDNGDRVRVYYVRRVGKTKDKDLLETKAKIFQAWLEKDSENSESNHKDSGTVLKSPYNITNTTQNFKTENSKTDQTGSVSSGDLNKEFGLVEKVEAIEDYDPWDIDDPSVWQELKINSQQAEGQKRNYYSRHFPLGGQKACEIKEALLSIRCEADLSFFKENVPYKDLTNRVRRELLTQEQREAIERIKNEGDTPEKTNNVAYGNFETSETTNVSDRAQPAQETAQPANNHPPLEEYEIGQRVCFMNEKGQWRKGFIADSRWLHDGDFQNWQFRGWLCRESVWQMEGGVIIPYQQCIMPLIADTA
ncbi:MAG: plasmid replication protein, CyRepA1 family [Halothece sp.]